MWDIDRYAGKADLGNLHGLYICMYICLLT